MSLKNVCMARCLRGQGFKGRKRVLLEQIWLPGRLMEGLFSTSASSRFMARFDFHSWGVKVGAASKRSYCAKVCSPSRGESLCLVDIAASPYGPPFTPSCFAPLRHSHAATASPSWASLFGFKARATTGNNGRSHSSGQRQPGPGLAESATLHGSAAKPKLTGEEVVEERRLLQGKKASGLTEESLSLPRAWVGD